MLSILEGARCSQCSWVTSTLRYHRRLWFILLWFRGKDSVWVRSNDLHQIVLIETPLQPSKTKFPTVRIWLVWSCVIRRFLLPKVDRWVVELWRGFDDCFAVLILDECNLRLEEHFVYWFDLGKVHHWWWKFRRQSKSLLVKKNTNKLTRSATTIEQNKNRNPTLTGLELLELTFWDPSKLFSQEVAGFVETNIPGSPDVLDGIDSGELIGINLGASRTRAAIVVDEPSMMWWCGRWIKSSEVVLRSSAMSCEEWQYRWSNCRYCVEVSLCVCVAVGWRYAMLSLQWIAWINCCDPWTLLSRMKVERQEVERRVLDLATAIG